jgi:hypothetical protein
MASDPTSQGRFVGYRTGGDQSLRTSVGVSTVPERQRETSWTGPVERDVLARIRRPLKLEAERIDGTDR